VPQPSDEGQRRGKVAWNYLATVFVENLSDERARTAIRTFDSQGRLIANLSSEDALAAGTRLFKAFEHPDRSGDRIANFEPAREQPGMQQNTNRDNSCT
jgi:hypothetical protein